ncbi:YybH family protein [Namhaeicola litoreus]|uniref:YybH family protein n=1 Tax=Namhaeicola litoreus TaxID=1052145 RepID=A0ABW3XYR1_9FLAO
MKIPYVTLVLLTLLISCKKQIGDNIVENSKNEILKVEGEFAEMAQKEGIKKAFLFYAAEDAVLMRGKKMIKGKKSLQSYFEENSNSDKKVSLTWKPDFVEVSNSGDLGYTYGKYVFRSTDSLGVVITDEGFFHTVWKKQNNGDWRFVWD